MDQRKSFALTMLMCQMLVCLKVIYGTLLTCVHIKFMLLASMLFYHVKRLLMMVLSRKCKSTELMMVS
jgi:hypothetical protein